MCWEEEKKRKEKGGGGVGRDWKSVPESTAGDTCSKLDSNSVPPFSFLSATKPGKARKACVGFFFFFFSSVQFSFCSFKIQQKQIAVEPVLHKRRIDFPRVSHWAFGEFASISNSSRLGLMAAARSKTAKCKTRTKY